MYDTNRNSNRVSKGKESRCFDEYRLKMQEITVKTGAGTPQDSGNSCVINLRGGRGEMQELNCVVIFHYRHTTQTHIQMEVLS